ncbi:cobalt chelatase, partial [Pseudomonas amygdali pv. tabaci str. ATCC 11528]
MRDLAWVILAPPMLEVAPWPQRHPLAGSDWVQDPQRLADFLWQLDRDSRPLEDWLALATTRRLGRYYERLWQFAVQHAPGVEI